MVEKSFEQDSSSSSAPRQLSEEESMKRFAIDHADSPHLQEMLSHARDAAEELRRRGLPFNPLFVFAQAKLRTRVYQEALMDLAAMNAQPFDSRRDIDV